MKQIATLKNAPILLSLVLGSLGGWLYWKYIGCPSGTCYIQSNAYRMTFYGAFLGALIYYSFKPAKTDKRAK